jgi:hypothetical protein
MSLRTLALLLVLYTATLESVAQKADTLNFFFETLAGDDSVRMFFNQSQELTDKWCAEYHRYTRIDEEGGFHGPYRDVVATSNALLGKGLYVHGIRTGYFETYYPTGKLHVMGYYTNNVPAGRWKYFYENGVPERTLTFTGRDTLLTAFVGSDGKVAVKDGQGYFEGEVQGRSAGVADRLTARGKIVNGKPDGKWTATFTGPKVVCEEEFSQGHFVKGAITMTKKNTYNAQAQLNTFVLSSYVEFLEQLKIKHCPDTAFYNKAIRNQPKHEPYTFNEKTFASDLKMRLANVLEKTNDPIVGDQYISVRFDIDDDGRPTAFSFIHNVHSEYHNAITQTLRSIARFPKSFKTSYFHMKLTITGGSQFYFRHYFSNASENRM